MPGSVNDPPKQPSYPIPLGPLTPSRPLCTVLRKHERNSTISIVGSSGRTITSMDNINVGFFFQETLIFLALEEKSATSPKLHFLSRFQSTVQWNTKKGYLPRASPKPLWLWQPLTLPDYVIWNPIRPSNYSRSGRTCCTFQVIRKRPRKIAAFVKKICFRNFLNIKKKIFTNLSTTCMQQLPHLLLSRLTSSSRRSTSGFFPDWLFGRVFSTAGRTCFTSSQS